MLRQEMAQVVLQQMALQVMLEQIIMTPDHDDDIPTDAMVPDVTVTADNGQVIYRGIEAL